MGDFIEADNKADALKSSIKMTLEVNG